MQPLPRLLVLGHRGSPEAALENTLPSFARAMAEGADGVELDVRPAADGTPVVVHDDTLLRTFGVDREVARWPWEALQRLTGARLPSFQQAAAWAAASGAWLNVELKAPGAEEAVGRLIEEHGLGERCFLSSFDPAIVRRVGEVTTLRHMLLLDGWNEASLPRVAQAGAQGVCLRVDAASAMTMEVLRSEGLPFVVWTVNDPTRAVELALAGAAAIITNRPGAIDRALAAAGLR